MAGFVAGSFYTLCAMLVHLLAALSPLVAAGADDRPPSVVFLLADDLGWKDLGCTGSEFYETPNLDGLAAAGMRFTRAYAAAPVCSPTRASILAGKYPARMDTTDYFVGRRKGKLLPAPMNDRMALAEITWPEALRAAGYRTFFAGKWHLGPEGFWPEQQGFDGNAGGCKWGHPFKGYFAPWGIPTLEEGEDGEFLTERLTDESLAFLDSVGEEPFVLYFAYYTVHTPLQVTDDLKAKYQAKRAALPPVTDEERWGVEGERKVRLVQDHAVYAGMVEALDTSVGRLLAKLDELGRADDTVVVFFSDNGGLSTSEGHPTSNVPLRAGKGWLYEGGIREPLIVRWPGVAAPGSTCDVPVTSTDFHPTMLALAGLDPMPSQHVDGTSLVPLLEGDALPARPLFWHYPHYGNQGGARRARSSRAT